MDRHRRPLSPAFTLRPWCQRRGLLASIFHRPPDLPVALNKLRLSTPLQHLGGEVFAKRHTLPHE